MPIHKLSVTNVGPFDDITFEFDSQINVFIGPNNTGKSSVLWTLGDVTVYPFLFPNKMLHKGEVSTFNIQYTDDSGSICHHEGRLPVSLGSDYWTPELANEHVGHLSKIGYSKFIPALRRSTDFISTGPTSSSQGVSYDEYQSLLNYLRLTSTIDTMPSPDVIDRQFLQSQEEPEFKKRLALLSMDPSLVSDETVIQRIIDLHYYSVVKSQIGFERIMGKICEVASAITVDFPVDFAGVEVDNRGFFPQFGTIDGLVPLNTLSQGTQSIIQWLAHLVISYAEYYDNAADFADMPGILIIDEIDAHLHPSWQRQIIPALISHFPKLQIFCSTHSPLMVAGLKAKQVQLLQRNENNRVIVSRNEENIFGWTVDEILRHFLGISDPTDIKAEERLVRLQSLKLRQNLTSEEASELKELRRSVSQDLIRGPMSTQLDHFAEVMRQAIANSH